MPGPPNKTIHFSADDTSVFTRGNNHLLVIGINAYQQVGKLSNAVGDAQAVRDVLLAQYTFEPDYLVELYDQQATRRSVMKALRAQIDRLSPDDNLLVYFSGHGHYDQKIKEAYWVPVDAEYREIDDYISYSFITKVVRALPARHVALIVDSCYSGAALVREKDLVSDRLERDPSRWLLASGRNEVVPDGIAGGNSPFAEQLLYVLHHNDQPTIRFGTLCDRLTKTVAYNSTQTPIGRPLFGTGDKGGEFILFPKEDAASKDKQAWDKAQTLDTEQSYDHYLEQVDQGKLPGKYQAKAEQALKLAGERRIWEDIKSRPTIYRLRQYIRNHPDSPYLKAAKELLADLRKRPAPVPETQQNEPIPSPKPTSPKRPSKPQDTFLEMIPVKGGTFHMAEYYQVTLSDYLIAKYPITQAQWQAVMGENPSKFKGDANRPVDSVSWDDCQAFIKKLNQQTGLTYRLPTEAEWHYAAIGGHQSQGYKYAGSNSIDEVAWYYKNSGERTHPVGQKLPNELGLYDMSGNVWEWCQDRHAKYPKGAQHNPTGPSSGSYRVLRGGSWGNYGAGCRVAYRLYDSPSFRYSNLGFRLARPQ